MPATRPSVKCPTPNRRRSLAAEDLKSNSEVQLKSAPSDVISAVKFAPGDSEHLLASSWDGTLRLYDTAENLIIHTFHEKYPLLDCVMENDSQAFGGGLEAVISCYDFPTEKSYKIGIHAQPVRCVEYDYNKSTVVTGSWDKTVKIWDPRTEVNKCVITAPCQKKVYSMNLRDDMLIVGTSERKILIWDLRKMDEVVQDRVAPIKHQIRCVRLFPDKTGFVSSTIEGRVAVEFLDPSPEVQKQKYSFKCHRIREEKPEQIHAVNAMSFHNGNSTLATGGADGFVNIWDIFRRKKICQFHRYPTGVESVAFSAEGKHLAIACSFQSKPNPKDTKPYKRHPRRQDLIVVRKLSDKEIKHKEKEAKQKDKETKQKNK